MKRLLIPLFLLLLMSFASATVFEQDTKITEGNINYIFKEGLDIGDFEVAPSGIKIDSIDKYGFTIKGGEFTVTFYEIDEISLKSSVQQEIQFDISLDGTRQYLFDGNDRYFYNSIMVGLEETKYSLTSFEDSGETTFVSGITDFGDEVGDIKFWEQKMVEFEISTETDDNGIIHNTTFAITYLWFTFIIIILIILVLAWNTLKKK